MIMSYVSKAQLDHSRGKTRRAGAIFTLFNQRSLLPSINFSMEDRASAAPGHTAPPGGVVHRALTFARWER